MTQTAPNREKLQLNGATFPNIAEPQEDAASSLMPENGSGGEDAEESFPLATIPQYQEAQKEQVGSNWLSGKRSLFLGIGIGIVLAVGGTRLLNPPPKDTPTATLTNTSATPTQSVTIAEVQTQGVNRTLQASGTVQAFKMSPVMSQATGLQIRAVLVEEGSFVKAGQLMVLLDDAILQAQLSQAKAGVAQAEARLAELKAGTRLEEIAQARETVKSAQAAVVQAQSDLDLARTRVTRNQMLQTEGAIARDRLDEVINQERSSQSTLAQAQARLREAQQRLQQLEVGPRVEVITQAEAQLAQAQSQVRSIIAQLQHTRVVAPVSGKVAQLNAYKGDISSSSKELFQIIENGSLELIAEVPETELLQIRPGQNVKITSNVDHKIQISGKVREIDPIINQKSRQAQVKIDLPSSTSLKPGMFLQASIITSEVKGLTIPFKGLVSQPDNTAIAYVLQADQTIKAQPVVTGEMLAGERIEIKSGLSPGDRVVVKGAPYLKDGDKVEVIPES